jgi:hypothetical protein
MAKDMTQQTPLGSAAPGTTGHVSLGKQPWQEPKLAFVEPRLINHGRLKDLTGQEGFFGGFSP